MQMFLNNSLVTADMNDGLSRAVVISLFTWRRADTGDVYDGSNKYGWWGDTYPVEHGDKIGSKLWQLLRRKLTDDVIAEVEEVSRDSLQWMIDDGICSNVDVSVERSEINRVNISVVLTVDGKQTSYKFKEV
jgi:phage gp46-like protein